MSKKTPPTSTSNELMDWQSIRTYEEVLAFCRRRIDDRKEHDLCEFAKKKILTKTRLSAMTTGPIAQPSNEASEKWKSAGTISEEAENERQL